MSFVPDLLSYASIHAPDRPAVIAANKSLNFRELDSRARRLVRLFRDYSLQAGDIVALLAKNEAEYFELHVAAMRTGLILLPLNFRLALAELEYIISDSRPKLLICAEEYSATAAALKVDRKLTLGAGYEARMAAVEPSNDRHWCISADATFVILYTSGTTGRPKGAIISSRALFARINCNLFEYRMTADEDVLFEHPAILEAAVIGLPDEKWGERVHAVLVFKTGVATDTDSVIAFARTRLAGYKLPKTVEVVSALPKNAAGKWQKMNCVRPVPARNENAQRFCFSKEEN